MRSFFCLALWFYASTSLAQQANEPVRKAVEAWLRTQTQGLPGTTSFEIGSLDPANQLAPCRHFEVSRPGSARSIGRGNVAVRCADTPGWRVTLPITVHLKADVVISARPIGQGQIITAEDLAIQPGDLADLPANTLTSDQLAIGKSAAATIPAGQVLRTDQLRAAVVVRQGQTVKVISRGQGFAVTNEGRAINNATEGQIAQIRLGSGQVVSGIARPGGTVEISY